MRPVLGEDMRTYSVKPSDITRKWLIVDADGVPLGRLASQVAQFLRGKHKPIFTPHMDTGDFVIVVNAEKVKLTGGKLEKKMHYRHSGYIGGLKTIDYATLIREKPTFVVREAVRGMLPHNKLGRAMLKKLKVYVGPDHPHQAQGSEKITLDV